MRKLPHDKYVTIWKHPISLIWHQCQMCGVMFRWEPFVEVITDRCLKFPSKHDKERNIVRYYTNPTSQTVCKHCDNKYHLSDMTPGDLLHESFNQFIDHVHLTEPDIEYSVEQKIP